MYEVAPEGQPSVSGQRGCGLTAATTPSATIHYLSNRFNPSQDAIISVARRLQEVLLNLGAIKHGDPLPFSALAPRE